MTKIGIIGAASPTNPLALDIVSFQSPLGTLCVRALEIQWGRDLRSTESPTEGVSHDHWWMPTSSGDPGLLVRGPRGSASAATVFRGG
jgi:hypothetical protein